MQEELLTLEKEFARAVTNNDADAVGGFLADDWIIIDPDGASSIKRVFSESSNPVFCPTS